MKHGFLCPSCGQYALRIGQVMDFPPDGSSDELTLQTLECGRCSFRGVATYEESRRGADESWHHRGGRLSDADFQQLAAAMSACPAPRNTRCDCPAHRKHYQLERDSWRGLSMFNLVGKSFPVASKR